MVVFAVARERGNIIPADRRPDLRRDDFVKRIVGLPGDKVEVRRNRVYINGELADLDMTEGAFFDEKNRRLDVGVETIGDCTHLMLDEPLNPGRDRTPFTVPEGRYFMLGDNRDHSRDSRDWGTVHFDDMKGPAFVLYWSWDVNGNFFSFLNPLNWWHAEKRWGRVFSRVKCGDPDLAPYMRAAGKG